MTITTQPNGYVFVPRADWKPRHPIAKNHPKMGKNRTKIFIHHTVTNPTDNPCKDMLAIEDVLANRKPSLLPGYSYTSHPSGVILEGAGEYVGAHTGGHNSEGFGFSLIGNYDQMAPTLIQLVNIARTINILRWTGYVTADLSKLQIIPHRATKATACPGANMFTKVMGKDMLEWIFSAVEQGV